MAVRGTYTRILVDEFDFSGKNNSVEVNVTSEGDDVTAFQDEANVFMAGESAGAISQGGYLDGVDGGMEEELQARFGTGSSIVAVLFGTNVAACPAYVLPGTDGREFSISAPVQGIVTLNGRWGEGEGIRRGLRVFAGELDSTGAETAVDFGAAGSNGGWGFLFVQAIDGSATDAAIDIESATTSGGTYASEGTFTFSDVGAYAIELSGTVNRHIRINLTSLGGADAVTVVAVVAVKGVTT